jgi:hypothetical protein
MELYDRYATKKAHAKKNSRILPMFQDSAATFTSVEPFYVMLRTSVGNLRNNEQFEES